MPGAGPLRVVASVLGLPLTVLLVAGLLLATARRARDPSTVAGGPMIITVNLNAAIDKTLAVPNFGSAAGTARSSRRRWRAAGGQRRAGAEGARAATVIATGVAGGPTGTRIIEHLTDEGILNDFVRIREESRTSTAVVDPTLRRADEINEHGPLVSEWSLSCSSTSCSTSPKGQRCASSRAACRAGWRWAVRPPDRRAQAARRQHRARLRGRAAADRHPQGS